MGRAARPAGLEVSAVGWALPCWLLPPPLHFLATQADVHIGGAAAGKPGRPPTQRRGFPSNCRLSRTLHCLCPAFLAGRGAWHTVVSTSGPRPEGSRVNSPHGTPSARGNQGASWTLSLTGTLLKWPPETRCEKLRGDQEVGGPSLASVLVRNGGTLPGAPSLAWRWPLRRQSTLFLPWAGDLHGGQGRGRGCCGGLVV